MRSIDLSLNQRIIVLASMALTLVLVPSFAIAKSDPLYDRLNTAVEEAWAHQSPGIMVGIEIPGRGRWEFAKGLSDIKKNLPMRKGMSQPVGSVTKTLTATLILQLIEKGQLSLDDEVSLWFPDVPFDHRDKITVRMILNMTSGISDFLGGAPVTWDLLQQTLLKYPHFPFNAYQMMMFGMALPSTLSDSPNATNQLGSTVDYSNTNSLIQARIAEKITGKAYGKLLSEKILKPLRMSHSYLNLHGGRKPPATEIYDSSISPGSLIPVSEWTGAWGDASGSLVSTVRDMQRWAVAFGTGSKVLNPQTQELRMQACHIHQKSVPEVDYCIGGSRIFDPIKGEIESYFHNGDVPGASSWVEYFPSTGASLVILVNQDDPQDGSGPPADRVGPKLRTMLRDLLIR